jgi:hypothetical protein
VGRVGFGLVEVWEEVWRRMPPDTRPLACKCFFEVKYRAAPGGVELNLRSNRTVLMPRVILTQQQLNWKILGFGDHSKDRGMEDSR